MIEIAVGFVNRDINTFFFVISVVEKTQIWAPDSREVKKKHEVADVEEKNISKRKSLFFHIVSR